MATPFEAIASALRRTSSAMQTARKGVTEAPRRPIAFAPEQHGANGRETNLQS